MRPALVLAALLAPTLLSLVPTGSAAAGFLTDPTGDVQFDGGVAAVTAPFADLTALDVAENDDVVQFVLHVAKLEDPLAVSAEYAVEFVAGDVSYSAFIMSYSDPGGTWRMGQLAIREDEDDYWWDLEVIASFVPTFDAEANTISFELSRAYLLDSDGRPPTKGQPLKDVYATAESSLFGYFLVGSVSPGRAMDRMPDDGASSYVLATGDEASGDLLLLAYDRMRVSNGGATTFVFPILVKNAGDGAHAVRLTLENVPAEWNASVASQVDVPAQAETWVPVFVSVPFGHEHGGYSTFDVVATSTRDAGSKATLRLGVLHTPIPQPAGHHNELFLHVPAVDRQPTDGIFTGISTEVTMNTIADHSGDEAEAVTGDWGEHGRQWSILLDPGLRMGLDFDVDQLGTLVGSIKGRVTGEGTLRAALVLVAEGQPSYDEDSGILLAKSTEETLTLDLQEETPFELTLTPTEESDYLPYFKGANMALLLWLDAPSPGFLSCCTEQFAPSLMTEAFKLTLPLNEYHDRLPTASEVASVLSLTATGEVEKVGRPGSLMTYTFTLKNGADREVAVDVDLAGTHAGLGELAPSGLVTLGPQEERVLTLGVRIPADAAVDAILEVLVFAHAQDDPSVMAIARTMTTVAKGQDAMPDESQVFAAAQEAENETPGAGALLAIAGVAVAVLLSRRR